MDTNTNIRRTNVSSTRSTRRFVAAAAAIAAVAFGAVACGTAGSPADVDSVAQPKPSNAVSSAPSPKASHAPVSADTAEREGRSTAPGYQQRPNVDFGP